MERHARFVPVVDDLSMFKTLQAVFGNPYWNYTILYTIDFEV